MTSSLGLFERIKTSLFKSYSGDAGKMLLHTATLGWIFSAAGQIFGIATNKEVSKEQKKFLIPQEMADAAINILSFYTITAFAQNSAKRLASSGKIITPAIRKFCEKYEIPLVKNAQNEFTNIGKAILDKISELKTLLKYKDDKDIKLNIDDPKTTQITEKIDELNKFYDRDYAPFESGIKVIGNVIGGVFSGNILTPLLRNPMAAAKQKSALNREKTEDQAAMYRQEHNLASPNGPDIKNPTYMPQVILGGRMKI